MVKMIHSFVHSELFGGQVPNKYGSKTAIPLQVLGGHAVKKYGGKTVPFCCRFLVATQSISMVVKLCHSVAGSWWPGGQEVRW